MQIKFLDLAHIKSLDLVADEDGKVRTMQSMRSILHLVHLEPHVLVEIFCRARKVLVRFPCPIAGTLSKKSAFLRIDMFL